MKKQNKSCFTAGLFLCIMLLCSCVSIDGDKENTTKQPSVEPHFFSSMTGDCSGKIVIYQEQLIAVECVAQKDVVSIFDAKSGERTQTLVELNRYDNVGVMDLNVIGDELYVQKYFSLPEGSEYRDIKLYKIDMVSGSLTEYDTDILREGELKGFFIGDFWGIGGVIFASLYDNDGFSKIVRMNQENTIEIAENYNVYATSGSRLLWIEEGEDIIQSYDMDTGGYTNYPIESITEPILGMVIEGEKIYVDCENEILEIDLKKNMQRVILDKDEEGLDERYYPYLNRSFLSGHFYYRNKNTIRNMDLTTGDSRQLLSETETINPWELYVYGDKLFYYVDMSKDESYIKESYLKMVKLAP